MAAIELRRPAVANLDLSIAGAMPIPDHEMVGETILHMPHAEMVDIKDASIPLTGAAVMDDDIFPPTMAHGSLVDRPARGSSQIAVGVARASASPSKEPAKESARCLGSRGWFDALIGFGS